MITPASIKLRRIIKCYLIHLVGMIALCFANTLLADNSPVVVVNPGIYSKNFLSPSALSAIFGMRLRKWEDGSRIYVFVLPDDDPLHIAFSKNVLRVFPYQLRLAWDRLVFSGTGEEPIKVKSERQMREAVGSTPGAIGYLSRSMIDETVKPITDE